MTGTCDYILFNPENLYILLFNKIKELNVTGFSDKDKAEYYHRCYKAVDGLWFVKTEQMYDFDSALEIDQEVWNIMPKIQARFLKKKLGGNSSVHLIWTVFKYLTLRVLQGIFIHPNTCCQCISFKIFGSFFHYLFV